MGVKSENLADQNELAPVSEAGMHLGGTISGPLSAEIAATTNGGPSVDEEDLVAMKAEETGLIPWRASVRSGWDNLLGEIR